MNAFATGRRIKSLICGDDFMKECLTVTEVVGISCVHSTRMLNHSTLSQSYLSTIRTDQRPELTCRALVQGAYERSCGLSSPTSRPRTDLLEELAEASAMSAWMNTD